MRVHHPRTRRVDGDLSTVMIDHAKEHTHVTDTNVDNPTHPARDMMYGCMVIRRVLHFYYFYLFIYLKSCLLHHGWIIKYKG